MALFLICCWKNRELKVENKALCYLSSYFFAQAKAASRLTVAQIVRQLHIRYMHNIQKKSDKKIFLESSGPIAQTGDFFCGRKVLSC